MFTALRTYACTFEQVVAWTKQNDRKLATLLLFFLHELKLASELTMPFLALGRRNGTYFSSGCARSTQSRRREHDTMNL